MNINKFLKPGNSTNVIAAAGTGKTWFIISKILRLLLADSDPDKITAITFTKKASAEMKNRLNEKIEAWSKYSDEDIKKDLKEIGIDKNYNTYVEKAKKLFLKIQLDSKDIRISTFDSFFMEILGQFYFDKQVPNNAKTNEYQNLVTQEIEKKFFSENYLNSNPEIKKNISFLNEQLGSYYNVKNSITSIIEKKSYFLEIYENTSYKKKFYNEKNLNISKIKDNFVDKIIYDFQKNKFLCKNYSDFIEKLLINNCIDEKIIFIKNFFLTKNDRKVRKKIANDFSKNDINLNKFLSHIFSYELNIYNAIQVSWKSLATSFFFEYQNFLKENNIQDYSDNTWLCYKKLSELNQDNWIFYKIANSIEHILIDEFQDTNYIQWKIISMVLDSMNQLNSYNSVTIVGDTKQSIYGFRGSEPKLFNVCRKYTNLNFNSNELFLDESRRSSKNIINFVNNVFETENNFYSKIKTPGYVEINILNESEEINMITEAENIALQINDLKKDKNIEYADITILVKNRTHINFLEETLIKNSIPVSTDKKESILDSKEIQDLFYLLKYMILSEKNTYELFLILKSSIFNYSVEEINKINVNDFDSLEKLLLTSKHKESIKKWKSNIGKIPMHDLIDMIYHDIDIIKLYYSKNILENNKIRNNFLRFINMSLSINNGRYISPYQFLYQIQKMKDSPDSQENLFCNSVKIMTIHSAKGLESDIVFLAQTYLTNNLSPNSNIVPIFNDDYSCKDLFLLLPKFFKNNNLIEEYFKKHNNKEKLEEENLFYVACTRAKRILVINGFDNKKYNKSWFSNFLSSQ